MRIVKLKKENGLVYIKLLKFFYRGTKFISIPLKNGIFKVEKDEEDHCYKLYFKSINGELVEKYNMFYFATVKEANIVKEEIENLLLKKDPVPINKILVNILYIWIILGIPIFMLILLAFYKTQERSLFVQLYSQGNSQTIKNTSTSDKLVELLNKKQQQAITPVLPSTIQPGQNINKNKEILSNKNLNETGNLPNENKGLSVEEKQLNDQLKKLRENR